MKLKRIGTCILIGVLATSMLAFSGCSSTQNSNESSAVEETTEDPNALNEKEKIVSEKLITVFLEGKFDPTGYKVFEIADYDSSNERFVAKIQVTNTVGNTQIKYVVCDFDANNKYVEDDPIYYSYKIGKADDIDVGKVNKAIKERWESLGLID